MVVTIGCHTAGLTPLKTTRRTRLYIGWSDVTYLWSQCDRHFVGQHVVLCVVKRWRFVALFEQNWISWFKKMSVLLRKWRLLTSEQQTFRRACPKKWRKTADMKKLRHCHPMYAKFQNYCLVSSAARTTKASP